MTGRRLGERAARGVVAALGTALVSCGGTSPPATGADATRNAASPAAALVHVRDNSFSPQVITVAAGSAVEWVWSGSSVHDVVGDGLSSAPKASGTYHQVFSRAGTYFYRCTLHEHMTGEVVVR